MKSIRSKMKNIKVGNLILMTCKLNREIVTNQNWKKFWTGSMRSTLKWITKIQSEFLFGGSVLVRPVCPRGRSPEAGPDSVRHVKIRKPYLTSRHSTMDRAEKWFAPDFCRIKNLLRPEFCLVTSGPDQRGCSRSVVQLRLIFDKEEEFSGPGILRNPTGGLRIIIVSPWLSGRIHNA